MVEWKESSKVHWMAEQWGLQTAALMDDSQAVEKAACLELWMVVC